MQEALINLGAHAHRMVAFIAGGARMFGSSGEAAGIGQSNQQAVQQILQQAKIPVLDADLGGKLGRRMTFSPSKQSMEVVPMQSQRSS